MYACTPRGKLISLGVYIQKCNQWWVKFAKSLVRRLQCDLQKIVTGRQLYTYKVVLSLLHAKHVIILTSIHYTRILGRVTMLTFHAEVSLRFWLDWLCYSFGLNFRHFSATMVTSGLYSPNIHTRPDEEFFSLKCTEIKLRSFLR